jgi:hypothetical protein
VLWCGSSAACGAGACNSCKSICQCKGLILVNTRFCREGCTSVGEFLLLVENIVQADAGFGLQAFCHFLRTIMDTALVSLVATPLEQGKECLEGAQSGKGFGMWDGEQAVFSLQRSVWALVDTLAFLGSIWRDVSPCFCSTQQQGSSLTDCEVRDFGCAAPVAWVGRGVAAKENRGHVQVDCLRPERGSRGTQALGCPTGMGWRASGDDQDSRVGEGRQGRAPDGHRLSVEGDVRQSHAAVQGYMAVRAVRIEGGGVPREAGEMDGVEAAAAEWPWVQQAADALQRGQAALCARGLMLCQPENG